LPVGAAAENTSQATENRMVVSAEELLVKLVQPLIMATFTAVVVVPNLQVAQEAKILEYQVQEL
jgi:hypothetical protein